MEGVGSGAVSAPFTAVADADCIIVIGARPTENHPVAATYFKQAAKAGKTLIVMDPRGSGLMRHATHTLRFKPGADVALLNSMIHVIVSEDLYDQSYISQNVEGFAALKARVADFSPRRWHRFPALRQRWCARWPGSMPGRKPRSSSGAWAFPSMSMALTMPLPDRAGADHRPGWPSRHRFAPAPGAEQCPGRVRCRSDPMVFPITARSRISRSGAASRMNGAGRWTPSAA